MEIKIGIQNIAREVTLDTDEAAADIEKRLGTALAEGGVLTIADSKGRKVLVPGTAIAYVELGQEKARPVGFGSI